jgi:hypothetical protein
MRQLLPRPARCLGTCTARMFGCLHPAACLPGGVHTLQPMPGWTQPFPAMTPSHRISLPGSGWPRHAHMAAQGLGPSQRCCPARACMRAAGSH